MKSILLGLFFVLTACGSLLIAQPQDYARYVNPFIGTGGHGHTFPGATMPFGMVQLSPDTRIDNWDGSSGYYYSDDIIYGFSHTHLSGTGIPDGCDILFMPTIDLPKALGLPNFYAGEGDKSRNGIASKFTHSNEKAEPGYYSVKLDDDGIIAELTATKRVGLHRYSFPKTTSGFIVLDLQWRDKHLDSELRLVGDRRLEGYRRSSSWAKNQTVYFAAEFSEPIRSVVRNNGLNYDAPHEEIKQTRAALGFDLANGKPIMLKVAISFVSIEGARKNLEAELPHWDFDKVRASAKAAWNKELSKIEVSGGTPEQTTNFYTALYHTMIQPNVFNDVDGRYRGHEGKIHSLWSGGVEENGAGGGGVPKVQTSRPLTPASRPSATSSAPMPPTPSAPAPVPSDQSREPNTRSLRQNSGVANVDPKAGTKTTSPVTTARGFEQYTVFSLWDTFRAAHPLYTIIDQRRTVDFINTFIRQYEQGGRLPVWELWGEETDTMIGYHAVSVIADAMGKGIKGFDYEKAYAASKHSAELDHFGLAGYKKRGYISMEDENESVSRTLEYAYNDWCIMSMASTLYNRRTLNKIGAGPNDAQYLKALEADVERYKARARYFENLFDSKTGFFRPKKNGGFVEPFAPNEVTFGFTEGNSWQYSFFVPHDVTRLMELMGGSEKFVAKLDELFTTTQKLAGREQADLTGLIGQYAHGNEPSHAHAYLYNYAGEPWKTQKYVRKIMDEFYRNAPDGLIGNEDCGQMSAWYVLSASGFYPVTPGSTMYAFGTPLFPEMKYKLENGKTFTIRGKNLSSKNLYIAGVKLNGEPFKTAYITHEDLMRGGVLEFSMTDQPVKTAFNEFPVSSIYSDMVAVPVVTAERTFATNTTVSLSTLSRNVTIYYTTDGSVPTKSSMVYSSPFTVDRTTTVKAIAIRPNRTASFPVESVLTKRPNDWTVKVVSGYSTQYTGGGENGIIDGIRGTVNFASGEWQGVQGKPYEAIIDLQRPMVVREVGASFLQVAGPWIWIPARIKFETSMDGVNFSTVATKETNYPVTDMTPRKQEYLIGLASPVTAKYVRLTATNFGKIPSWHLGAGGDPWIFVDEIFIN